MNKRSVVGILTALAIFGGAVWFFFSRTPSTRVDFSPNPAFSDSLESLTINDVDIQVAVADTSYERTLGLSGTQYLPQKTGMLFVFEKEEVHGFWMKDMLFPIDMIWISSEGEVVHIEKEAEPSSYPHVFKSTKPALYVLEVPSGFSTEHTIATGSKLVFPRED